MTIKEMISEILETVRTINNKCPWFRVTYSFQYSNGDSGIGSCNVRIGKFTNKTLHEACDVIREKFFCGDDVSILVFGAIRLDDYEEVE